MRVLMSSQRMPPHMAGAETQAVMLASALRDLGVEVDLVSTRHVAGLPSSDTWDGLRLRRLPALRKGPEAASMVAHAGAMASYVAGRARRYDLVHAHCLSASTLGAIAGARAAGTPIVVKPSLGGREGELAKIMSSPARGIAARALRGVHAFAVLDDTIEHELGAVGVPRSRLRRLDNGVDLRVFHPSAGEAEREALRASLGFTGHVVLFVGQLTHRKGIPQLVRAWRLVRERLPDALLAIAGAGDVASLELAGDGIRLLGVRDDVPALMRAADALVLPSFNESFGNVVVEALASGLPVIASSTGIVPRLDLESHGGATIDPGDPADIAGAIARVVAASVAAGRGSAASAENVARRCRALAEPYDIARVAADYLALYREIVGGAG